MIKVITLITIPKQTTEKELFRKKNICIFI